MHFVQDLLSFVAKNWFVFVVVGVFIACVARAICKWDGVWRVLAAALGVVPVCAGTWIVVGELRPREDRDWSFFGWQLEVVIWFCGCLAVFGVLWIVRAGSGMPGNRRRRRHQLRATEASGSASN